MRTLGIGLAVAASLGGGGSVTAGSPAADDSGRQYVATFTVPNPDSGLTEKYHIRLTETEDIATARGVLSGVTPRKIPVGRIVYGEPDVNSGYSWHIATDDFTFADYALKICDVPPSVVESGAHACPAHCPWSATIVGLSAIPAAG